MPKKLLAILIAATSLNAVADTPDTLDDITVTATRTESKVKQAPSSVTVMTRKDIAQKGGENVLETLRGTPGISLQGVGSGGRKTISLRGLESKHTLLLVDGKRLPASNDVIGPNTDYQYDWIPVEQIERIEVVRGPMSVLYGSDALGGVVNIITRKPSQTPTGDAKLTSRSASGDAGGDGHDVELNLSGGVRDNLQLSIGGQQSRRSAVTSQLDPRQSAIEGRDKQQLSLSADWQPAAGHNVKLEHSAGQEERWYDTVTRTNSPYQSRYDLDRQQTSLGWKGSLGNTVSSVRAYQSSVDIVNTATNGIAPTDPQTLQDTVVEGNTRFTLGDKHFITTGVEHRTERLENPKLSGGSAEITLKSAYAQDEIALSERTHLTVGVRQDEHDTFGGETSPRVSIVHDLNDKLTLKASYGHGFRAPTIKQVSPGYSFQAGRILIKSNPDLQPETNDALELGASYNNGKLNLNAAVFDNKVKNLIDTRLNKTLAGGVQEWVYANTDEASLRGAEVAVDVKVRDGLKLNTSYQYLDAKDGDEQRLDRRPRHTLSAGVAWEKNGWKTNLQAEHLADQTIASPTTGIQADVPDYTVWNAGVRKAVSKHLELGVGIENLTDVRLEEKSTAFRHEEYPRTVRLELKGSF
ncbi:TonB-dependent receptor plug domain-containing protein [Thiothrix winogradskyi]|uniref:TonB-dependent receptor n=1 Tax=Thiothrix winogradskyi TaxID=96472 RepID=A0ABY3SXN0_9GAMM|nr:TonB-dependent receptor [Thiothrix winogradskyi]UJS24196.1 TonB-dependent receptor [Thiothrix winogradskyi]